MITVDAFSQIGECRVFDQNVSESALLEALNSNKVSAVLASPFPGAPNPARVHDTIASLAGQHPGRVFGLVNVNPHIHRDTFHKEVERCIKALGFVGLVLHTLGHAVNPNGEDGTTVFEAARELGVPLLIHTGSVPFGLPSILLRRARDYGDLKIILAHAGAGYFTAEAEMLARECSNIYLETSGLPGREVKRLIDNVGANRILMGSETPANQAAELAKYRSLGLYHYQQFQSMGQNTIDLFGLKGVTEVPEPAAAEAS